MQTINLPAMIEEIRERCAKVDRIDPEGPFYKGVCRILDKSDLKTLRAIKAADIKFVSALANNRIYRQTGKFE